MKSHSWHLIARSDSQRKFKCEYCAATKLVTNLSNSWPHRRYVTREGAASEINPPCGEIVHETDT